jgi:hypothetical protein
MKVIWPANCFPTPNATLPTGDAGNGKHSSPSVGDRTIREARQIGNGFPLPLPLPHGGRPPRSPHAASPRARAASCPHCAPDAR